jgi:hypothetical protein
MFCQDPGTEAQVAGVFSVYSMPETLPYDSPSYCAIPLGYRAYFLVFGVAKGPVVR